MLKKLFRSKVFKFLLGGGLSAAVNIVLIMVLIEGLGWQTPFLQNLANAISIELSLLFSFFVYRIWVWPGGVWSVREVLGRQIPLYHVSAGGAVISRIFLIFPLLHWLGVDYRINTLIGVLVSASLNYLVSDRYVFKTPVKRKGSSQFAEDIYYPEGLAPALESNPSHPHLEHQHPESIQVFSLVIPAHNEEGCIIPTIDTITHRLEAENIPYEILVVNDNSKDRTEEILQELSEQNPRVRYINNYYPNGFGFAVRCGLENFEGDAVAIVMADSSDDPDNIVDYYYKLQEGYDCVFGSRFVRGGRVVDYPTHKLIVNRWANLFIQVLFALKFNDTTNAFKAYRREVIEGISPLISHHFNLTVEIPLKAMIRGYSYATVPIIWRNRKEGVSKLKLKEMGSRYLFIVLYLWLEKHLSRGDYKRKSNPKIINKALTKSEVRSQKSEVRF